MGCCFSWPANVKLLFKKNKSLLYLLLILFSEVDVNLLKCRCFFLFFLNPRTQRPRVYLWLMCNTKPWPTPFSHCFACLDACVCCTVCTVRPSLPPVFLGGFTMRFWKWADLWNVMVRNSLSGRVKTSPLISAYRAETKYMSWSSQSLKG